MDKKKKKKKKKKKTEKNGSLRVSKIVIKLKTLSLLVKIQNRLTAFFINFIFAMRIQLFIMQNTDLRLCLSTVA